VKQGDIKQGYLYALASTADVGQGHGMLVLSEGMRDWAAEYSIPDHGADLSLEYQDPASTIERLIAEGLLIPAPGYTGGDGPFEGNRPDFRHGDAHGGRWLMPWSEWAPRAVKEYPDHPLIAVRAPELTDPALDSLVDSIARLPQVKSVFYGVRPIEPHGRLRVFYELGTELTEAHHQALQATINAANLHTGS
jgi:hypothetical protein